MSTSTRQSGYYDSGDPRYSGYSDDEGAGPRRRFANGWAVVPLRLFFAAVFLFGAFAKLTYPGFFDPNASLGFHSAVQSAKDAHAPLSALMGPMVTHASTFGHLTAYAELAIGLGLLVGLLTRVAALGGMIFTGMIVLSVNWTSVKEYTGNGGWFTSVDLAAIAALSVFLLGGAGPLSIDAGIGALRRRRRARRDAMEPSFTNHAEDLEDSRRRLRGDSYRAAEDPAGSWGGARQTWSRSGYPEDAQRAEQQPGDRPDEGSLWDDTRQYRDGENPR